MVSNSDDGAGVIVYGATGSSTFGFAVKSTGNQYVWLSATGPISPNSWHHVVVEYNLLTISTAPIAYVDDVLITMNVSSAGTGTAKDETGTPFSIGNWKTVTYDYSWPLYGKIFDARVYNRILTAAEVTELYNAGVPDHTLVTDGIVFQGPAVYADLGDDASLAGTVLTSTFKLVENTIRAVGIPHGSPIIRANP